MTFSFMLNTAELTALECPWNTLTEWMGGARKSHNLVVSFMNMYNWQYGDAENSQLSSYQLHLLFIIIVKRCNTVEPPITDPPRSGQPPYTGHTPCYRLKLP